MAALAFLGKRQSYRLTAQQLPQEWQYGILKNDVLTEIPCVDLMFLAKMEDSGLFVFVNSAWWCCWYYSSLQ